MNRKHPPRIEGQTWDMYAKGRIPLNRKRSPVNKDQAPLASANWDTYAQQGKHEPRGLTRGFPDITQESVSLSYGSTIPDYVFADSGTHTGFESRAKMPSPENDHSLKKPPRYNVPISVIMAAQAAAQKTLMGPRYRKLAFSLQLFDSPFVFFDLLIFILYLNTVIFFMVRFLKWLLCIECNSNATNTPNTEDTSFLRN
jgi:hypothetical protein